jgi:DNA topoisomerase-1
VISPAKQKVLEDLKKAAEKSEALYVATDPDREGEAIGWHLAQELAVDKKKVYRITFNEITERAVKAAFTKPGKIDMHKVDAQQARRVLDRLVGYSLSPLLWDKVQRGLSAGRVQSVAVRLIVDREREIVAFVPVEYWSLHARLSAKHPPEFEATLREWRARRPRWRPRTRPAPSWRAWTASASSCDRSPAASAGGIRPPRSSPPRCSRTPAASSGSRRRRP